MQSRKRHLLKKPLRDNRWFLEAACKGLDPDMFYPDEPTMWPEAELVKQLCDMCPVRTQCIDFSVTSKYEEQGWWGISPEDRRQLRREYKAASREVDVSALAARLASEDVVCL